MDLGKIDLPCLECLFEMNVNYTSTDKLNLTLSILNINMVGKWMFVSSVFHWNFKPCPLRRTLIINERNRTPNSLSKKMDLLTE